MHMLKTLKERVLSRVADFGSLLKFHLDRRRLRRARKMRELEIELINCENPMVDFGDIARSARRNGVSVTGLLIGSMNHIDRELGNLMDEFHRKGVPREKFSKDPIYAQLVKRRQELERLRD